MFMKRLNKDGSTDKRYKTPKAEEKIPPSTAIGSELKQGDPQLVFNRLLEENNLQLDFDVLEGTIPTQFGIVKIDKPTLVVKATYVSSK